MKELGSNELRQVILSTISMNIWITFSKSLSSRLDAVIYNSLRQEIIKNISDNLYFKTDEILKKI